MSKMKSGDVRINSAKIALRKEDDELILYHVPSERFVVLDEIGQRIWQRVEDGTRNIETIINIHSEELDVPSEVAAYQVISFLDELRAQGFIDFNLPKERDTAPLLDTPLSDLSPQVIKRVIGRTFEMDNKDEMGAIVLDAPRLDLSLRDIKQIAERVSENDISKLERAILIDCSQRDLTLGVVKRIVENPSNATRYETRLAAILEEPNSILSLKELRELAQKANSGTPTALAPTAPVGVPTAPAIIIIIIIITDGPIIIIIIDGGPGPTRGKSRSACKTMCV